MRRMIATALFALITPGVLLSACGKKNPADQAAQDVKAIGAQRDKAQDAVKAMEESQRKSSEAAAKAADGE